MFKGELIENRSYYQIRSRQLILFLLYSLTIGFWVNFYKMPIWLTIVMFGMGILAIIAMKRGQKQMKSILENKLIEIDEEEIRIMSNQGGLQETIIISETDKLILKKSIQSLKKQPRR